MSTPTIHRPHRREDEFTGERHVFVPHSVGLPPLGSYARELWRRREFAVELARTKLREQNFDTAFGQLWLVLNPLLMALVYFILVDILRASDSRNSEFFAHLVAGLFLFQIVQNSMTVGVRSVTKGGRLILNSAFPRALLPLSAVITAFMRFLPTMIIYIPIHIASGLPVNANLLWCVPIVALFLLTASGLAMLVAAAQVYFRDLSNFLPVRAADLALRLAGPLLHGRGAAALQVAPRHQPGGRPADRLERRPQRGQPAGGRGDAAGRGLGRRDLRGRRPVLPLPGA